MRRYLLYVMVVIMLAFAAAYAYAEQNEASKASAATPAPATAPTPAVVPITATPAAPAALVATPAAATATPASAELSIYGEVQNINVPANSMMVQYYDYDNDEEKSTEIVLDGNSKLENAKAIGDIKKGDWVDVTYTASAGKNTAKTVSVEKEEPVEENAPAVEE